MTYDTTVGGVRVLRPLLAARRHDLRHYLAARGQSWREDASNASDQYFRNRLRGVLRDRPELVPTLLDLGQSAHDARAWAEAAAPTLPHAFRVEQLHTLPSTLARVAARRWLVDHGVPAHEIEPAVLDRLLRLASDAASPPSVNLPGGVTARRAQGIVSAAHPPTDRPARS
jgi:tRNA(Ile)-lysidine synthase